MKEGIEINDLEVGKIYRCRLSNRKILILSKNLESGLHQTKCTGWLFNPAKGNYESTSVQENQLDFLSVSVNSLGKVVEDVDLQSNRWS